MFLQKLEEISQAIGGRYDAALENCRQDWPSSGAANANISAAAAKALDDAAPTLTDKSIDDVVAQYASHQPASGATPRAKPPEPLRRVIAPDVFKAWNLAKNVDSVSLMRDLKLKGRENIPLDKLTGASGLPTRCSWWTWGNEPPTTLSGATYIEQLALPRSVDDSARAHGGVIEISIESANFPNQLYKPSALDGFCAGTRFRPDLTTKHHGESAPANPGTHPPRPELVSSPVDLAALNKTGDEDITVRYIPYYLATGTP